MFSGNRLALGLGVLDAEDIGDDLESRKKLANAACAMVRQGLAVVLNKPATKQPICILTTQEINAADQAAREAAHRSGDVNWSRRHHACGISHAMTEETTVKRVFARKSAARYNLGVEPRASGVMIVDLDTAAQSAAFALRCGENRPQLTVRSPGQRDASGEWAHRDGGHIWFSVPEDKVLPLDEGIYAHPEGWTAVWGEHQVLVPPSVRAEGPYRLVGSIHPLPDWLYELIVEETTEKRRRRSEAERRRRSSGPGPIDDWSTRTPWAEILEPDDWVATGLVGECLCPLWTAPGLHGSPKSATAHEPGCSEYACVRGHGPLHVWTYEPSEAVRSAMDQYNPKGTLTKAQVATWTLGSGSMHEMLREQEVEADEPMIIRDRGALLKWEDLATAYDYYGDDPMVDAGDIDDEFPARHDRFSEVVGEPITDPPDRAPDDEVPDDGAAEQTSHAERYSARMVENEKKRLRWRQIAMAEIAAEDMPKLAFHEAKTIKDEPRPKEVM